MRRIRELPGHEPPIRVRAPRQPARRSLLPFIAHVIVFHSVWLGYVLAIYPSVTALGEATLRYALVNITLRFVIWVLPVFVYLHVVDHVDPIAYLCLKHRWRRGVGIGLLVTGLNGLASLTRFGLPHPSIHTLTWNSVLSTSLLIGFIEEIPYRGFILQKCLERCNFWVANLISSVLFVAMHVPGWISLHLLRVETVVFVFLFGIVMAVVFRYATSLWSVIVVHSLNDLLAAVVFQR